VIVELTIDALAAGGDGVGREPSGRVVMVARTAPGDRVRARLVEEHARWARGELVEVVALGPARVEAPCPLAATCGGCPWQHVDLDAQRAAKTALVAGPLRRLLAGGLELRPIATPVAAWGWRRRARLHWIRPKGRPAVIGFFGARSRRIVDVAACPQLDPALDAALGAVRGALGSALRESGEIHLAAGAGGRVHVVVDGPVDPDAAAPLVGTAGIDGVVVRPRGARGGAVVHGAARIDLEPDLAGAADDFAQASAAGNDALRAEVTAALGPGPGALLELFAGAGNFTRDAVAAGWTVTASDRNPAPALAGTRWITGAADEVVAGLAAGGDAFDAVLLDPPRTGAREVCAVLGRLGARRVVYVSCDPPTLGRDAELLAGQGYTPRWARPLDLMPQTAHVEVVCLLER